MKHTDAEAYILRRIKHYAAMTTLQEQKDIRRGLEYTGFDPLSSETPLRFTAFALQHIIDTSPQEPNNTAESRRRAGYILAEKLSQSGEHTHAQSEQKATRQQNEIEKLITAAKILEGKTHKNRK